MSIHPNNKTNGTTEAMICPIPSDGARFIVTIDGKPYAGFVDRFYAEQAVKMWLGEIDGAGLPVPFPEREIRAWPAIRGRRVEIVER
jgi:hypothetical protein